MATNMTISVPDDLLQAMKSAAHAEGKTVDEIMQEAAERFLDAKRRAHIKERWTRLSERGQDKSTSLGYTENDVDRLIHADREAQRGR